MREIDWEKLRSDTQGELKYKFIAAALLGMTIASAGIGLSLSLKEQSMISESKEEVEQHKLALSAIDADKKTPNDIDIQPMP